MAAVTHPRLGGQASHRISDGGGGLTPHDQPLLARLFWQHFGSNRCRLGRFCRLCRLVSAVTSTLCHL